MNDDLISRSALLQNISETIVISARETGSAEARGIRKVLDRIEAVPSVDAVEVVRCKDCKHKGWIQEPCHGKSVDFCHVWDSCINSPEKCFCSYGERKNNAADRC